MAFDGPLLGGRFRLGPQLGKGAQAETFLAKDGDSSGAEVVVKRLKLSGSWKQFDLLEREAKVLGQLRHPGVPRYIATIEEPPGTFNLVMERMPGEDLRRLAQRRRLSPLELRDILVRSLEVLDYLHTRTPPVVHRDVKPSNLVRAPDGRIAVVDFGGVLDAARERGGSTVVGTFGYIAPEQLHGQAIPATDLYALGATIVSLAGGIEPEDVPRRGLRMDLDKHLPNLDPDLRAALSAMTEPDPDKRPQRARDVVKLLGSPPKPAPEPRALTRAAPRELADRRPPPRLFSDVQEPLGAMLRLGVLGFAASGWFAMLWLRFAVWIVAAVATVIAFPARRSILGANRGVQHLLTDGQGGFADLAKRAVARDERTT